MGGDDRLRVTMVFCNLVELEGFEGARYDVGFPASQSFRLLQARLPV